jgi:thymidylate synthase
MNNLDKQYLELVNHILQFGYTKSDRTGTGTKSIFGWQIRHSMKEGFPLLTTKKVAFKTMVTELLWFLRGDTNIKYLVDNGCHIWDGDAYKRYYDYMRDDRQWELDKEEFINKIKTDDEFAKKWGSLGPVYGAGWRRWKRNDSFIVEDDVWKNNEGWCSLKDFNKDELYIDQIANAIHLLKTDPDSRRILVNSWNTGEIHEMVLPPCHYSFQFYTRELSESELNILYNKRRGVGEIDTNYSIGTIIAKDPSIPRRAISLLWNQRSVDVGLGLPFNIASYALLLEIIAKEVNMIPEEVIGNLGDCHIYLNHEEGLKEQLTRIPYELPKIKIQDEVEWKDGGCLPDYSIGNFSLENYQSHPAIKLPLSN